MGWQKAFLVRVGYPLCLSWLEDIVTQGSFKGPFPGSSHLLLVGLTLPRERPVTKRSHWGILLSDALLWRYPPPLQAPSVVFAQSLGALEGHPFVLSTYKRLERHPVYILHSTLGSF